MLGGASAIKYGTRFRRCDVDEIMIFGCAGGDFPSWLIIISEHDYIDDSDVTHTSDDRAFAADGQLTSQA